MKRSIIWLGLFCCAAHVHAQTEPAYAPSYERPDGRQITLIYVGSSECGPCLLPETKQTLEALKLALAHRADERGDSFAAIGVAVNWEITDGLGFLQSSGAFDEIIVGHNWWNVGTSHFIWADDGVQPFLPQVIVAERTIDSSEPRAATPYRRIARLMIPQAQAWLDAGADLAQLSQFEYQ